MTSFLKLNTSIKPNATTARRHRHWMEPSSDIRSMDWGPDGDTLHRPDRPNPDTPKADTPNCDNFDHRNDIGGSPIPRRNNSTADGESSGSSCSDPVKRDDERFHLELMAELATLEAMQAELRRRIRPSTAPTRELDNRIYQDRSDRMSLAESAYAPAEEDWFETPMGRDKPDSLFRQVVIPAFFALAVPIFAGAVAVMLFVQTDQTDALPNAVVVDNGTNSGGTNSGETGIAVATLPASVTPTEAPSPNNEPRDSIIAVEAPPPDAAPRNIVAAAEAPALASEPQDIVVAAEAPPLKSATANGTATAEASIADVPVPPQGGVTLLQRRDPPPASTASVVAPVQTALATPAPAIAPTIAKAPTTTEAPAKASTAISAMFAPLDADVEPSRDAIPREAIALAPTQSNELQPLAVEPTSDAAAIKPGPEPKPVIRDVKAPSQPAKAPSQPTETARANTYVNMRAGPNNDEAVITVVPAKAPIAVVRCKSWCEVIYNGRRGWIYKGFVDRSRAASASSSG